MHDYKKYLEILWEDLPGATHCISSRSETLLTACQSSRKSHCNASSCCVDLEQLVSFTENSIA